MSAKTRRRRRRRRRRRKKKKKKKKKKRRKRRAYIKSNNPHLTGGEKSKKDLKKPVTKRQTSRPRGHCLPQHLAHLVSLREVSSSFSVADAGDGPTPPPLPSGPVSEESVGGRIPSRWRGKGAAALEVGWSCWKMKRVALEARCLPERRNTISMEGMKTTKFLSFVMVHWL